MISDSGDNSVEVPSKQIANKILIEEIGESVAISDAEKFEVDTSGSNLVKAVEQVQEKKDEKANDMFKDFKNLNSEFESLDWIQIDW